MKLRRGLGGAERRVLEFYIFLYVKNNIVTNDVYTKRFLKFPTHFDSMQVCQLGLMDLT